MNLNELKQFLTDCIEKQIPFPREMMTVVLDDFYDVVPVDKQHLTDLEFSHRIGNEFAKVKIIPKPDEHQARKAKKWDDLSDKIAKCYVDKNGNELSEEESEDIDLGTIGEIAASAFGWL